MTTQTNQKKPCSADLATTADPKPPRLTLQEKRMLADICNGWIYPHAGDLSEIDKAAMDRSGENPLPPIRELANGKIVSDGGAFGSALELAIIDVCNNCLEYEEPPHKKWAVDLVEIVGKIRSMTASERALLLVGIRTAFERSRKQPGSFIQILEALPV